MDWIHFEGGNSGAFPEFMKNGSPVFSTNQLPEDNPIHLIIQRYYNYKIYNMRKLITNLPF